jgi:hypothetical protein
MFVKSAWIGVTCYYVGGQDCGPRKQDKEEQWKSYVNEIPFAKIAGSSADRRCVWNDVAGNKRERIIAKGMARLFARCGRSAAEAKMPKGDLAK